MKKQDWETDEFVYAIDVLLAEKSLDKNLLKAIEELTELSLKLTQYINKPESISKEDIEEEIADVEMHLFLLKKIYPVSNEIREQKINKFLKSKEYNFYLNRYESINY